MVLRDWSSDVCSSDLGADGAIVLNYDRGLTFGILVGDIEPRTPSQGYRIAKTDSARPLSIQLAHEMKRHLASF